MQNKITALSANLGKLLRAKKWHITTAESCTGGGISAAITEVSGSSSYFDCAFVTYSNQAKERLVNVLPETLETHGAVSEQVVQEMALGAMQNADANMAIAVSGIAGPGGGTIAKPVGTVCIAISVRDSILSDKSTVWSQCFLFEGERFQIRMKTVKAALNKACEIVS